MSKERERAAPETRLFSNKCPTQYVYVNLNEYQSVYHYEIM